MTEPIHVISLGAGVQSSTMALMAAAGEITPMPTAAVFADTQAEPKAVYEWLDYLDKQLPFPIHRVTQGNLGEVALRVRTSRNDKNYQKSSPPAFIYDGERLGLLKRQCTEDFKLAPIFRELNRLRLEMREPGQKRRPMIQWIGISLDEAMRMKDSRRGWCVNYYPLVEKNITRQDCLNWMEAHGHPRPPRSACTFCPYHDDREWLLMKENDPEAFAGAAEFERRFQETMKQVSGFRGVPYLHRSLVPLTRVKFNPTAKKPKAIQTNMNFGNECEGMCGV